jgi:hypothetical protein
MTPEIERAVEALRGAITDVWDVDRVMTRAEVEAHPLGRFVLTVHTADPGMLGWLCYFVARRTLPCWEQICPDPKPRRVVDSLGSHLRDRSTVDWGDATSAAPTPHQDCYYTETQGASDCVAAAARYLREPDPLEALYCLGSADTAYDHTLVEDQFRNWLLEVATIVAFEKREMTETEQESLRSGVRG